MKTPDYSTLSSDAKVGLALAAGVPFTTSYDRVAGRLTITTAPIAIMSDEYGFPRVHVDMRPESRQQLKGFYDPNLGREIT